MTTKAGYSGTPLAKKLGIKAGYILKVYNSPKPYVEFFMDFPSHVTLAENVRSVSFSRVDFIHIFVKSRLELDTYFAEAKARLKKSGILWVSWPKKSSGMNTELDKFAILEHGLQNGLVDTKVAAIDDDWGGHKFMYRLKDR
ncbi:DUF3052 family protein [Maribacter cobaltidurans]|jgi:hypothetical protein|uniref:Uncharacterized protein n=1 Tax=Maribacter cobaltidurans TaxID=1178778 RepID=A0A223V3J1_9FLAO|nr:DUF3052 family protein [Maribacter cobaltidurans]ASV29974.1 hypothetical protein CJ263_06920 [Maribacter cobaltidurans]GGD88226.1 hypothetical protein GCM10011412_27590 [Maribacter cobaltidurans]